MNRSFKLALPAARFRLPADRGTHFWLQVLRASLILGNAIMLLLYVVPPGGTRHDLTAEQARLRNEIVQQRTRATRLKTIAGRVQTGSRQSDDFEGKFFLPRREAYAAVVGEIQRLAAASGLHERDAVYSEEPVEGTADLSLLNSTANYEGTYDNLVRFLGEVDQSPLLLMLDNLQAAPQQQKGGTINTSIRFQAIIRDDGTQKIGGQS